MEQKTLKKRVAVYCRVGTDPCFDLDAQRAYYAQKIEDNPDWELVEIFADEGLKSTDPKGRKGFNRMMAACQHGCVDLILTKSVSRFARNAADALRAVRFLRNLGVGVIFEKENFNTLVDSGEFRTTLFNLLAKAESESITKNFIYPVNRRPLNQQL